MNQEIIRIAREAGLAPICEACDVPDVSYAYESWDAELERFATLVAAAEREACAKVCDELAELNRTSPTDSMWDQEECAAAIRARGEHMTKQTEALKLALEALEHMCMHTKAKVGYRNKLIGDAMDKVREALAEQPAQPQQEPVAWRTRCTYPMRDWVLMYRHPKTEEQFSNMEIQPLYTSPPASKPWVGLTEKEKRDARNSVSYSPLAMTMGEWTAAVQDATEAKLREKNT